MDDSDKKRLVTKVGVKGNIRVITITDNVPEHWDELISIAKSSYSYYAYIYHDCDVDSDSSPIAKHLHLICFDKGGTTLKRHIERFSSVVPGNFIEKVRSPRAMVRYLIHLDQPTKFQYDRSLIVTNSPDKVANFLSDFSDDVLSEYSDFIALYTGRISISDYLEKYRGEFATMPFYQKQAFFHKIVTMFPQSPPSNPPH